MPFAQRMGHSMTSVFNRLKGYEVLNGSGGQNGPQINMLSSGVGKCQDSQKRVYYFRSASCDMQPAPIDKNTCQSINMINSAGDSDNLGCGPNYPSNNSSFVPAGDISNGEAVGNNEDFAEATSPLPECISELPPPSKGDSPRDTVLGKKNIVI